MLVGEIPSGGIVTRFSDAQPKPSMENRTSLSLKTIVSNALQSLKTSPTMIGEPNTVTFSKMGQSENAFLPIN